MSAKKNTQTTNPCGLTSREVEIAVFAWKCLDDDGKASNPSQTRIDKQKLADIANIGQADSAARMWRGIKAKISLATGGTPGTPGTPAASNGDGAFGTPGSMRNTMDAAVASGSPSVRAAEKKAGPPGGRKRAQKEVNGEEGSDGAEEGARPKKAAKHAHKSRASPKTTAYADPAMAGTEDGVFIRAAGSEEMEAGEV